MRQIGVEEKADGQHGHREIEAAQDKAENDDGDDPGKSEPSPIADDDRSARRDREQHSTR